jgi:hypothetical protein
VLWDSATHDWGFIVREIWFLGEEYGPVPLFRWLQHVSTVVGSAVVAAYGVYRLSKVAPRPSAAGGTPTGALAGSGPVSALIVGISLRDPEVAVGAALLALVGVAIVWRSAGQRAPGRPRTHETC